jgi:hypothetical protein
MPIETIYGVSVEIITLIIIFFIVIALFLFGPNFVNDPVITVTIFFLILGLTMLIGYFGWAILIIPSVIILAIVAVFLFF